MVLNSQQLAALIKAAYAMVAADGEINKNETDVVAHELKNFNVTENDLPRLLAMSEAMDSSEMFRHLSSLSLDEKKYVSGFLAVIMIADGNIDDNEVAVWQLTCSLANFPSMSMKESIEYWRTH